MNIGRYNNIKFAYYRFSYFLMFLDLNLILMLLNGLEEAPAKARARTLESREKQTANRTPKKSYQGEIINIV